MVQETTSTNAETAATADERTAAAQATAAQTAAAASADEGAPSEATAPTAADLAGQLARLSGELTQARDEYLRTLAEMENVRRRAARDRAEAQQYAITGFARDLLSVADSLARALASVAPDARGRDPLIDGLLNGVEMTERQLLSVFERHGLSPIEAAGKLFDPHVHEAMFEIPDPGVPSGTVVQELERGYRLHDRTLRPARVGVAKGGPRPEPAMTIEAAEAEDGDKVAFGSEGGAFRAYESSTDGPATPGTRVDETL